jgi:hypothetical protein
MRSAARNAPLPLRVMDPRSGLSAMSLELEVVPGAGLGLLGDEIRKTE